MMIKSDVWTQTKEGSIMDWTQVIFGIAILLVFGGIVVAILSLTNKI